MNLRRQVFPSAAAVALPLLVLLTGMLHAQDVWQGQNIYQIVTDRFFNGDVTNDNADGNANATAGQGVHGGDFKGIEQKLDYIKALGATAIWISPILLNGNGDYHGYAASDFYRVDPHWGTLADLQHLIQIAHAKGLLVINDIVVNHGGQLLNSNDGGYPNFKPSGGYNVLYRNNSKQYAAPFNPASGQSLAAMFHTNGFIQNFYNTLQVENGSLEGLDDFRTESSYVQTNMASIYKFWFDQGFDGFRVDTVKHADHGFWQYWCPQIHQHAAANGKPGFFMFGEVYDGSESKCGSYTGTVNGPAFELDSVLDYPLYFSINNVFALGIGSTKQIEDHYHAVDANYDPSVRMRLVTFLDNHDQARFLNSSNANNNADRLGVALVFLHTARGIPCVYYGTEQGFNGGADPNNREDMFAGQFESGPSVGDNFNETNPLFQLIAKLNNFRRLYPALRNGSHVNLWNNPSGPGVFAYSRVLGAQEVIVVFNTATIPQLLPNRPTTYAPGTTLVNLLDANDTILITANQQTPTINLPATTAKVYIAQSQLLPLDPVVTNITPVHDAAIVPTPSKIVVTFSKPMNTASVEAAFSLSPSSSGTITWSDAHDQLTFQSTNGLPELSTIKVHINEAAAAADGTQFHSAFDSRFTTAVQTVRDVTPPTLTITYPAPGSAVSGGISPQGDANDDVNVARVEASLDNGPWLPTAGGSPSQSFFWYYYYSTEWDLNGRHTLAFRAVDTAGNVSAVMTLPLKFANVPPGYERAVFAYGSAGYGSWGCGNQILWESDAPYPGYFSYGYIGGNTYRSSNPIANVCSQEEFLYQSERYGSPTDGFRYLFRCPPGLYQVDILEAETFMSGPNQRRFDIYANGQKVVQNFDIFLAAGGANLGITKTITVNSPNTFLDLQFKPVFDAPRVSAIHVKKIGDAASDPDGVHDWWRLIYFGHATGLADDQSRGTDDPDNDGMTNYQESMAGTDPHDAASVFRISSVSSQNGWVFVSCPLGKGKTYQLQRSNSLSSPNWGNIDYTTAYGNYIYTFYDAGGASLPLPRFYRVVVVP